MSRAVLVTGALLIALGLGVFATKTLVYGLPVRPADTRGLWQVELRITVRGDGRQGSVTALLPGPVEGQVVLDERSTSDRLQFSIRSRDDQRVGVWQGRLDGVHEIFYQFRVQSRGVALPLPEGAGGRAAARSVAKAYGRASHEFPAERASRCATSSSAWRCRRPRTPLDRVRKVFAFVTHEIATAGSAGSDALLTLAQREGNETGKARLLVTLLRAAGVPARLVRGLELRELAAPRGTRLVRGVARHGLDPALAGRRLLRGAAREPRAPRQRRPRAGRGDRRPGRRLPLPLASASTCGRKRWRC